MKVRILDQAETRSLLGPKEAIAECRVAYAKLGRGEVELPDVLSIEIKQRHGEVHAKGGYLHGSPTFSIKVATGWYDNPALGLPVTSGAVWVFSAVTGQLSAMILDDGYLTELRTGAAGAVAADLLARPTVDTVGIIGAGAQAGYQLEALLEVRRPTTIQVFNRNRARAETFAAALKARLGRSVVVRETAQSLVESSDLIVTTTPSVTPVVMAAWVQPGTHITAMGSDMPSKRELEAALLAKAAVVPDRLSQCLTQGELHHAVAAGLMKPSDIRAELGEVAAGLKPGRENDHEITIADLTGVGVLDAAVASAVVAAAESKGIGRWIET